MPPNSVYEGSETTENLKSGKSSGDGPEGQPGSTYAGIWRYPTNRDDTFRSAENWMECKKKDDDIGNLWRVHDKLYDLSPFIQSHPGGPHWLTMSQGTDITENFVASHAVNFKVVERMLENYYVMPATSPRISPYTLKENGFYMTLKRRTDPIFKKVGTGPTVAMRLMQDGLAAGFMAFAILACMWSSVKMAMISGVFLAFQTIGSHNWVHQRENWRRYYFDLSFGSSYEFRITHAFSHHMYPNTLMDFELHVFPTFQFLPNRPKHWIQRKFALLYSHFTYAIAFWLDLYKRIWHIVTGEKPMQPENVLPFVELLVLMTLAAKPAIGFWMWVVIHTTMSYVMVTIGATASHHHSTCYVDGDEPLADPDFGIGQLDATKDRSENFFNLMFVTLVTFGHHPLHHMFPTVCHSKLPYVKEVFEQTIRDFKLDFPGFPQKELYLNCYDLLARTEPLKRENLKLTTNYQKME